MGTDTDKRQWLARLNGDPIPWLLEPDNPSVRYFTLTEILEKSPNGVESKAAKAAIATSPVVEAIFAAQFPEGYWESATRPYAAKYRGTVWQLILLAELGVSGDDGRVRLAVEHLFRQGQHQSGGFTSNGAKSGVLPCLSGNMVRSLLQFGYLEDERVARAIKYLLASQDGDGGWRCRAYEGSSHPCLWASLKILWALGEIPQAQRTSSEKVAIERGAQLLLRNHLFRSERENFKVLSPGWLKFGFPLFYQGDVLQGLRILTQLGYADDERLSECVDILLSKQDEQGRWALERSFAGKMHIDLEER
ncbi:MAG: nitrogen fixation protein NifH, partial [Chloroflexi bacterium]|nr:nitrogen fixation protein NifH [Chloroflexota bacterium]